ncbi:metalloprotease ybeY [Hippea maritima DSM 10411]|uniref:Endoribonuclease YbeY n=2 Tax=Hippea TaxID=84404 RepID=F2LWF7_HIPMA|nr:metalloprotease ybeY [Hippea maritima DSM 10411]
MNLTVIVKKPKEFIDQTTIESFVEFLFKKSGENSEKELNIVLVDDDEITKLNEQFKNRKGPTNVLSFYGYDGDILGDIAISSDTIEREALEKKENAKEYLLFIIAHGFLHLVGYTHETMDKFDEMMKKQKELVDEFLKEGVVNG